MAQWGDKTWSSARPYLQVSTLQEIGQWVWGMEPSALNPEFTTLVVTSKRPIFPLRGLRERGRIFIAKGRARGKKACMCFACSPYHTIVLHLMGSRVQGTINNQSTIIYRVRGLV